MKARGKQGWFPGVLVALCKISYAYLLEMGTWQVRGHVLGVGRPRYHETDVDNRFFSGGVIFTIQQHFLLSVKREAKEWQRRKGTTEQTYVTYMVIMKTDTQHINSPGRGRAMDRSLVVSQHFFVSTYRSTWFSKEATASSVHKAGCCKCEHSHSRIREDRGQATAARLVRSCGDDERVQRNDEVLG